MNRPRNFTGVDAEVSQLTDKWVGGNLEGQRAKWLAFVVLALDFVAGLWGEYPRWLGGRLELAAGR
jgi:hypothetical protein